MMDLICFGPPGSAFGSCDHPVIAFIHVGRGEQELAAGLACACHQIDVESGLIAALILNVPEMNAVMLAMVPEVAKLEAIHVPDESQDVHYVSVQRDRMN